MFGFIEDSWFSIPASVFILFRCHSSRGHWKIPLSTGERMRVKRAEILYYESSFAFPDPLEGSDHILRAAIQGITD